MEDHVADSKRGRFAQMSLNYKSNAQNGPNHDTNTEMSRIAILPPLSGMNRKCGKSTRSNCPYQLKFLSRT